MKTKSNTIIPIAIAACLVELNSSTPTEIQLLPCGTFKARDGRPQGLDGWTVNVDIANSLIAQANAQTDDFVIDYEHQVLNAKDNGQPAPASGWFKQLEWRDGVGLFAVNVEWTATAKAHIENKEYRYISPVFSYNAKTGAVTKILMAALVNTPALDGMKDLAAAASSLFNPQETAMDLDELLERLRYFFNLPTLATIDEIVAEMDKLKSMMQSQATETATAKSVLDLLSVQAEQIAALKTNTPDPSKFVPIAVMSALQTELAALKADLTTDKVNVLVTAALSDGRLLPAQKDWAESLGKKDLAALSTFLDTAQPIAALSGMQTGGKAPDGNTKTLTADEIAVCKNMGITAEQFLASKEATV